MTPDERNRYFEALARYLALASEELPSRGTRLWPRSANVALRLAHMTNMVAKHYDWLHRAAASGLLENLTLAPSSGLPWAFDFTALDQRRASDTRPEADDALWAQIEHALESDDVPLDAIDDTVLAIHQRVLMKDLLSELREATLAPWRAGPSEAQADLERTLGGESWYSLHELRFFPSHHLFGALLVELQQDIRDPHVLADGRVSDALRDALRFSPETTAHQLWATVNDLSSSLRPLHVAMATFGPFEHAKTRGLPGRAPLTNLLTQTDRTEHFVFRIGVRSVFASPQDPNPHGDWTSEIIVVPASHAAVLARSILGDRVLILEA